jgi:hypothetical protein
VVDCVDTRLDGRCGMVNCVPPSVGVPFGPDMADVGRSEVRSPLEIVEVCGLRSEGRLDDAVNGCGTRVGAARLVERLMMSFPCTTRLSVDFFRSRVSI